MTSKQRGAGLTSRPMLIPVPWLVLQSCLPAVALGSIGPIRGS